MKPNDRIIGRPIRCNRQALKNNGEYTDVIFLGDVHWGSPQCDKKRFTNMLDYCLKHKLYVLLMGDMLEMSTRDSVGSGVYEQDFPGQTQHEQMVEMLRPLAEAKLILGTHSGNHCDRVYKSTGVNIAKALARELSVPFLGAACWNEFRVGKQTYTIYSLHGATGSRFDGTALLAVERISTSFFCDLVAHAHIHKCVNSIVLMQRVVNGRVTEHKKHLLITGSYLTYDKSYGQALGLPISKLGSPRVRFYSTKKDIVITW